MRIFEKKLEKRLPPQVLGNKFMVFRSLVAARPLQELRSRRLMSQRNSHFPKHLKPSRPQRLQRLAGDACQCEGVNCRLRIASSGSATIVAQDRRQKAKLLRNWTSGKHFLPSHQNGRSRKDPSKILLWIQAGVAILGGAIAEIMRNALKIKRCAVFLAKNNEKHNIERF